MSLFRSTSFRIKKRDKAHRPPPLEEMPERPERESLDGPPAPDNFLAVPDSARSAFFTLPSAGNSRSSLFRSISGASSTSGQQQDDKPRTSNSFFKLSNLSKGSFVSTLRRDRAEAPRGRNTFDVFKSGAGDDATDLKEIGYIPFSKRQRPESAEISMTVSMSNLLSGLDVVDIAPPVQYQTPHRQRSRTLSTKSAPDTDTPDNHRTLHLFTGVPLPTRNRSSFDTPSQRRKQSLFLPRSSLDTPVSSELPELNIPPTQLDDTLPPVSNDSLERAKFGSHSPSPTIISATSVSTAQDSLMGSYDVGSSESDPDQSFLVGEDDCGPIDANLTIRADSYEQSRDSTEATPSKIAVKRSHRPSPLELRSPNRPDHSPFSFPGPSTELDVFDDQITPLESVTSKIKPKLASGESQTTPARKLAFKAGNTPPGRRLKIRRPSSIISRSIELASEDAPPTPSTPSFLVGLAWPRPPFRQVYVDTREPGSSWHSVSTVTNDRLVDGGGNVIVEPGHIIMLAHAIDSFTLPPDMGTQQPLSPSAASALAMFALTASLVSA